LFARDPLSDKLIAEWKPDHIILESFFFSRITLMNWLSVYIFFCLLIDF
jgi:hypothetical protein